jgi:hypothetical protein
LYFERAAKFTTTKMIFSKGEKACWKKKICSVKISFGVFQSIKLEIKEYDHFDFFINTIIAV